MTNTIALFARYNQHANKLLFGLLDDVGDDLLNRSVGAYFGSITGILNHILTSYLVWLVRFRDGGVDAGALLDPVLDFEHPGFGKSLHEDFETLKQHQFSVDRVLTRLAGEVTSGDGGGPDQVVTYVNSRGETHAHRVGDVLFQVFNHATHHRGHVSQILDQSGVDHDFSNMLPVFDPVAD